MSSNKSANTPAAVGRAVFKAGEKTEVVDFSLISELREKEDELTWDHWPTELVMVALSGTFCAVPEKVAEALAAAVALAAPPMTRV